MSTKDQRKFPRHSVSLKGACRVRGQHNEEIDIRNFCRGGLFIAFTNMARAVRLAVGEVVEIVVLVRLGANSHELAFPSKVVRLEYGGCGLAFIEPDMSNLQVLQDYLIAPQPLATGRVEDRSRSEALASGCRQIIESRLEPMVERFVQQIESELLAAASEAELVEDQAIFFYGVEAFKRSHNELSRTYRQHVLTAVDGFSAEESEDASGIRSSLDLSIVEDDVVDDWIAVQAMANRSEVDNLTELSALERRLSVLFGLSINRENNPYGPTVFSSAFQHAIATMKQDSKINHVAYGLFKEVLSSSVAKLVVDLNQYLIKSGVMPTLKYSVSKQPESTSIPETDSPAEPISGVKSESVPAASPNQPSKAAPETATHHPQAPSIKHSQPVVQNGAQELSALINELQVLRDQVSSVSTAHQSQGVTAEQAPLKKSSSSSICYDARELIQALNQVESAANSTPKTQGALELPAQVKALLSQRAVAGQPPKVIAPRQQYVMESSARLYDSLAQDELVAEAVRPWIKRLELPMMKLALLDESVLTNRSHAARELINKIAQLEMFDAENKNSAISEIVSRLIDRMNAEENVTEQTFADALKRVNGLIALQQKVLAANLAEVVEESEKEQPNSGSCSLSQDDGIRSWQFKLRNLAKGNWVLFEGEGDRSERLRLAWVGKNHDRFVFVNVKGQKARTLSSEQLAICFERGEAILLDSFEGQPVDRAQYRMLHQLHRDLLHETSHDQLTGTLNRREFEKLLKRSLERAIEAGVTHSLCFCDLDQFVLVNANFGYSVGDKLLANVANMMERTLKKGITLARIGGNTFAYVLESCSPERATGLVKQQQALLEKTRVLYKGKRIPLAFSASVVALNKSSGDALSVLQMAETGCRLAKEGNQRIRIVSADDAQVTERHGLNRWAAIIDDVLDNNRLALRAQKIAPLSERRALLGHSEILLVVKTSDGQLESPFEFVTAAERFHRIGEIDRWVVKQTFQWIGQNIESARALGGLAINLSGKSLSDQTFVEYVMSEARAGDVPMDLVCFEVTETAGIDNLSDSAQFIRQLKETGCRFALDDFGTGMSSYGYLKDLPVDYLKIDGVFVKDMLDNPADAAVVKSITEIGHFLGKKVVAEYVENEAIADRLREIGVDYAQGWGIEKPIMLDQLAESLSS